jgi:hypothetical protein
MTTTTFSPGDKVRVTGDAHDSHYFPAGTLAEVVEVDGGDHLVTTDPAVREWQDTTGADGAVCRWVLAEEMEPVEEPPAAASEPAWLIDIARAQALYAARDILGDAATRADVVEVARFILGEGEGNVPTDNAPAVAPVDTSEPLKVKDEDGDVVEIREWSRRGSDVRALVFAGPDDDAADGAYLTAPDIDRVIAYLTALKA